jgi:hypothetical protein
MFGIVIENVSRRNFFSEKLMDCILLGCMPIYWGCSNIGDYFNDKGILTFSNADDAIYISKQLTPAFFHERKKHIVENFEIAKTKTNYYKEIYNVLIDTFNVT